MKNASKEYKNETKKAHATHRQNIHAEVRNLRNLNNSQKYWDYIKQNTSHQPTNCNIDFAEFVIFF